MERCIGNESFKDTGLAYTLKLIKGKYKMRVLYTLMEFGAVRFGEMKRYLGEISFFMLNRTLKELEADDLIKRKEYDQLPLKVEYSLTKRGKSLIPLLDGLCAWGDAHKP
ncbi:MAG: helix-turn-helix transcriptional regulator [Selenomonadaceae bacterium]|nr:helix-turn-helix transcriptional regulator [Selenomonadaceae bacterium]